MLHYQLFHYRVLSINDVLRDSIIFIISVKPSFENTNVVVSDLKTLLWMTSSVANTISVNPKGTKMLLSISVSTFPTKPKSVFSNGPRSLPGNPPHCIILDN